MVQNFQINLVKVIFVQIISNVTKCSPKLILKLILKLFNLIVEGSEHLYYVCLSVCLSVCVSVCLSVCLSVCVSACLSHLRSAGCAERTKIKKNTFGLTPYVLSVRFQFLFEGKIFC